MVYTDDNRFKVRVGVVVLDAQNRLLLARQNNRPFWVLPGGTLEPGETMGACAVREIREETGLDIALGPLLFVGDFVTPQGQQVVDVVFGSTLQGGALERETTENINDLAFFTPQQLTDIVLKPEPMFQQLMLAWETGQWPQGIYLGRYA